MNDIVLEVVRVFIIGLLFVVILTKPKSYQFRKIAGWSQIVAGLGLIFLGALIDITDNFPTLNRYIIIGETEYQAFFEKVVGSIGGFLLLTIGIWRWLPKMIEYDKQMQEELREVKKDVTTLSGLLPICASCKKIRNDAGYWEQLEAYIHAHSDAEFSHGICPECKVKLYPEIYSDGK